MGYIYEAMDRAKEAIAKTFNEKKVFYERAFAIIDARWNNQLHQPLHATGHFLNPEFFYSNPDIEQCTEIMGGLYACLAKLVGDKALEDKIIEEISLYRDARGIFGIDATVRSKSVKAPGKLNCFYFISIVIFFVTK